MVGYPNMQASVPGNVGTDPSQTNTGIGTRPGQESGPDAGTTNSSQDPQQQQPPIQQPYAWRQPAFNQQWNWNLPPLGVPFQFPGTGIGQVYLRMTVGMLAQLQIVYIYIS